MPDLLTAALEYAAAGIAVIPCQPRGKKPALAATGKNHSVATSDTATISQWWTGNPDYNIGIPGTPNQLAVIDIDGDGGIEYIEQHPELAEPLHDTWAAATAKGAHYYYRWPAGLEIRTCDIAPQLEIRAAGAYTIAPPSIHPNGHQYTWKRRATQTPAPLPPEWAALTPQQQPDDNVVYLPQPATQTATNNTVALKRLHGLTQHLANTTKGNRHRSLYTIARTLGQLAASNHLTTQQIETALHQAATTNGLLQEDGTRNITQTITDGITKGIQDGPDPEHHETTPTQPLHPPWARRRTRRRDTPTRPRQGHHRELRRRPMAHRTHHPPQPTSRPLRRRKNR